MGRNNTDFQTGTSDHETLPMPSNANGKDDSLDYAHFWKAGTTPHSHPALCGTVDKAPHKSEWLGFVGDNSPVRDCPTCVEKQLSGDY
jgi:hypothetical protein